MLSNTKQKSKVTSCKKMIGSCWWFRIRLVKFSVCQRSVTVWSLRKHGNSNLLSQVDISIGKFMFMISSCKHVLSSQIKSSYVPLCKIFLWTCMKKLANVVTDNNICVWTQTRWRWKYSCFCLSYSLGVSRSPAPGIVYGIFYLWDCSCSYSSSCSYGCGNAQCFSNQST